MFGNELECYKCKYDFTEDYERFFSEFAFELNYHEGFEAHNTKMGELEDCTDENGECDCYRIEFTCPNCGTKKQFTDWSK